MIPTVLFLPSSRAALAIGAGLVVGVSYALSPVTFLALSLAAFAATGAARGLGERERGMFLLVIGAGLGARLIAIAAFVLLADPGKQSIATMFGDEYLLARRGLWVRNIAQGIPILPSHFDEAFDAFGQTGFNYVLAIVQTWFGEAPYAFHVLNAVVFTSGAVLLFRATRVAFGRAAAFLGLVLVLFMPTVFAWSIAVLKESFHFLITAVALVAAAALLRGGSPHTRRAAALALLIAFVLAATLRNGALAILAAGLSIGTGLYVALGRRAGLVAAAVAAALALGAFRSAPAVNERVSGAIAAAARQHVAHVQSPGHAYRLLDDRFYAIPAPSMESMTQPEAARFLLRAASSFVLVPLPWQAYSTSEVLVVPQQMLWYLLVLLAVPGSIVAIRRDRALACVLIGLVVAGLIGIAPQSGNIGTLVRMRDIVTPFVLLLSGVGVEAALTGIAERVARRRSDMPAEQAIDSMVAGA